MNGPPSYHLIKNRSGRAHTYAASFSLTNDMSQASKRYNTDKRISIGGADIPIAPTDVNQIMGPLIHGNNILLRMKKRVDKNILKT
jgi:hypothetical protein